MSDIHLIVNRQINRWNQERQVYKEKLETEGDAKPPSEVRPVITMSTQCGCRADELAKLLAHELHYGLFDKEIVNYIAQHLGVRSAVIESLDEHERSNLETWVEGILKQHFVDRDDYLHALGEVTKTASLQGGVVLLGRGSNFLLQGTNAFRTRLVAPFEVRKQNLFQYRGESEKQAVRIIERVDRERAHFIQNYFKRDIDDATAYDLVLNMEHITLDAAVKIILSALRARGLPLEWTGGDKRARATTT